MWVLARGTQRRTPASATRSPSTPRTRKSGYVTFFSRTRNTLWMKGESSGNKLRVLSLQTDCDEDTVLIRVRREGAGVVCHLGTVSCFATAQAVLRTAGEADDFGKAC